MSILKPVAIAAALTLGTSVIAFAQQGGPTGNPASNAAESGGSGTHQSTQKTGTAENNQKVVHNQGGYRNPASRHHRRHHRRRRHED